MDDLFGPMDFLLPMSYEDEQKAMLEPYLDDYMGFRSKFPIPTPAFPLDSLTTSGSTYFDMPSMPSLTSNSPTESWRDFSGGETESDYSHNADTPEDHPSSPEAEIVVQDHVFKTWYSSQANAG
jgi:hypothetical protein